LTTAVSSQFTIAQPPATQLVFTTSPTGGVTNTPFPVQPVVTVEDANGNLVRTDSSTVTLKLNNTITQVPSCSQSESGGVVTFSGCRITSTGTYTVAATDGALRAARSGSFNVTGPPAKLAFTTSPTDSQPGMPLATLPVVSVEDLNNNVVTTDSSTVVLSISAGTGAPGAVLSGCSETEASGVVTFAGCSINKAGSNYTLRATDGSLTAAVSSPFDLFGAPYQLVFTTSPVADRGGSSRPFTVDPVIAIEDSGGNVVTSFSSTISLSTSTGTLSSCSSLAAVSGIVAPTGCIFNGTSGNSYYLTVSYGGLINGRSASFVPTVISFSASPYLLIFTTSPDAGASGATFTTQPVLEIDNQRGTTITNGTGATDTVRLSVNGVGGAMSGCTHLTAVGGIVNLAGCTFTGIAGNSYYITATDTSRTLTGGAATSASFAVSS
jgi:hypothetical protein